MFRKRSSISAGARGDFSPIKILEVEIGQHLPFVSAFRPETGQTYVCARSLVRLHTQPLGIIELRLGESGVTPEIFASEIWRGLNRQINAHLDGDGLPMISNLDAAGIPSAGTPICETEFEQGFKEIPFVSVIVPTRDRSEMLARSLQPLLFLNYPAYEIIVVDNAPRTQATAQLIKRTCSKTSLLRYVREDRPGTSWARNRGLVESKGEIVAYTDDDVQVDSNWLTELVKPFASVNVVCVTGLVLPAEIETQAQEWFEQHGGYGKGFKKCVYDIFENRAVDPLYPYRATMFGQSNNAAFRSSFLRQIGGFDTSLGVGMPSIGGEDTALFFQVITEGFKLVYQPAAIVYHFNRRDYADIYRQFYGFGVGLTSFLTKSILDNPGILIDLLSRLPYALNFTLSSRSPKNIMKRADFPEELTNAELIGLLRGPVAYVLGKRRNRKITKQFGALDICPSPIEPRRERIPSKGKERMISSG